MNRACRMHTGKMHKKFLLKQPQQRDHLEDLDIDWSTIFK
jgi:hypothetical protein